MNINNGCLLPGFSGAAGGRGALLPNPGLLEGRPAVSAGGAAGAVDPLLLQRQQLLQRRALAALGGASVAPPLPGQELAQVREARHRMAETEIAARASVVATQAVQAQLRHAQLQQAQLDLIDRGLLPAAAGGNQLLGAAAAATYGGAGDPATHAAALMEHLREQQWQQQAATLGLVAGRGGLPASSLAEQERLGRLLQLRRAEESELLRRAALQESLERNQAATSRSQLLEGRLLQGGLPQLQERNDLRFDLDATHQAYADALIARELSSTRPLHEIPSSSEQRTIGDGALLRQDFRHGVELETSGGHLLANGSTNSVRGTMNEAPPLPRGTKSGSRDDNQVAKFLATVARDVPEIKADLDAMFPTGGEAALLKGQFPRVADATLLRLEAILMRNLNAGERFSHDLHDRVTHCVTTIKSYRSNAGTAEGHAPLLRMLLGVAQPIPSMGYSVCHSMMLHGPMNCYPTPGGVPSSFLSRPDDLNSTQQTRTLSISASKKLPTQLKEASAEPEEPSEDLPLMAAYRLKKKTAKADRKRKRAASKMRRPHVVHRPLNESTEAAEKTTAPSKSGKRRSRSPCESTFATGSCPPDGEAGDESKSREKCRVMASGENISHGKSAPINSGSTGSKAAVNEGRVKNKTNRALRHQLFANKVSSACVLEETKMTDKGDSKK